MKAFISYKYTNEPIDKLKLLLSVVCDELDVAGVKPYCIFFEKAKGNIPQKSPPEMMQMAFDQISQSNMLFVIQSSELCSEGLLMEVGYAIAKDIPVIVATQSSITNTYLPGMAAQSVRYDNLNDLRQQMAKLNFIEFKPIDRVLVETL